MSLFRSFAYDESSVSNFYSLPLIIRCLYTVNWFSLTYIIIIVVCFNLNSIFRVFQDFRLVRITGSSIGSSIMSTVEHL